MQQESPYYTSQAEYQNNGFQLPVSGTTFDHSSFQSSYHDVYRQNLYNNSNTNYYEKLNPYYKPQNNSDETLVFESRFESGNLR